MNPKSALHDCRNFGAAARRATARGLTEKADLCEHTLSLMSDPDHLAFDKAA
jgi:hypothetical protein